MAKIMWTEWLSIRLELESLCRRIVHDGRDPLFVADAMMQILARDIDDLQHMWDETRRVPRNHATAGERNEPR